MVDASTVVYYLFIHGFLPLLGGALIINTFMGLRSGKLTGTYAPTRYKNRLSMELGHMGGRDTTSSVMLNPHRHWMYFHVVLFEVLQFAMVPFHAKFSPVAGSADVESAVQVLRYIALDLPLTGSFVLFWCHMILSLLLLLFTIGCKSARPFARACRCISYFFIEQRDYQMIGLWTSCEVLFWPLARAYFACLSCSSGELSAVFTLDPTQECWTPSHVTFLVLGNLYFLPFLWVMTCVHIDCFRELEGRIAMEIPMPLGFILCKFGLAYASGLFHPWPSVALSIMLIALVALLILHVIYQPYLHAWGWGRTCNNLTTAALSGAICCTVIAIIRQNVTNWSASSSSFSPAVAVAVCLALAWVISAVLNDFRARNFAFQKLPNNLLKVARLHRNLVDGQYNNPYDSRNIIDAMLAQTSQSGEGMLALQNALGLHTLVRSSSLWAVGHPNLRTYAANVGIWRFWCVKALPQLVVERSLKGVLSTILPLPIQNLIAKYVLDAGFGTVLHESPLIRIKSNAPQSVPTQRRAMALALLVHKRAKAQIEHSRIDDMEFTSENKDLEASSGSLQADYAKRTELDMLVRKTLDEFDRLVPIRQPTEATAAELELYQQLAPLHAETLTATGERIVIEPALLQDGYFTVIVCRDDKRVMRLVEGVPQRWEPVPDEWC